MKEIRNGLFPSGNIPINARGLVVFALEISFDVGRLLFIVSRRRDSQRRLGRKGLFRLDVRQRFLGRRLAARPALARTTASPTSASGRPVLTQFAFAGGLFTLDFIVFGQKFVGTLVFDLALIGRFFSLLLLDRLPRSFLS